jgi:hypothetical protein
MNIDANTDPDNMNMDTGWTDYVNIHVCVCFRVCVLVRVHVHVYFMCEFAMLSLSLLFAL